MLVDLINRFAFKGGFDAVVERIETLDRLTPTVLSSLMLPFGSCASYLNAEIVGYKLGGIADKIVHFIKDMKPEDMKEKVII